jgi:hypothetical protein
MRYVDGLVAVKAIEKLIVEYVDYSPPDAPKQLSSMSAPFQLPFDCWRASGPGCLSSIQSTKLSRLPPTDRAMDKINDPPPIESRERRKHRRFPVRYPVYLKWLIEGSACEVQAVTNNASVSGFLIDTPLAIPQDCPVEFTMAVYGGHVTRPVLVSGEGHVVRIESPGSAVGYAIALKCKRDIELNISGFGS